LVLKESLRTRTRTRINITGKQTNSPCGFTLEL